MKFKLVAYAVFEADDIDYALVLLAHHFLGLYTDGVDGRGLDMLGEIKIEPVAKAEPEGEAEASPVRPPYPKNLELEALPVFVPYHEDPLPNIDPDLQPGDVRGQFTDENDQDWRVVWNGEAWTKQRI